MLIRIILLFLSITITSFITSAQTLDDALRMSDINLGSTARSAAVGGSMTAIGGDYSVISANPAGLAVYRSGQFMTSGGYIDTRASSVLLGSNGLSTDDNRSRPAWTNAGYIWSNRPEIYEDDNGEYYRVSKWQTSNFTIGFNRLSDFNTNISFAGTTSGSIADQFLYTAAASGGAFDEFGDQLAFNVNLIDNFNDGMGGTVLGHDAEGYSVFKQQTIERRGSINEIIFGWAGNYDERLLLGANVGVPIVSFKEDKIYNEIDQGDLIPAFNSTQYVEELDISGAGFNIKIGAIYMPNRNLRLGAAIHSPTFYQLSEEFSTAVSYDATIVDGPNPRDGELSAASNLGEFSYKITTPWRFSSGLAYIFGRKGFLSADIEYINYAGSSYDLDVNFEDPNNDLFEQALNDDINDFAASTVNIRFGGELAFKGTRVRAGYGLLGQQFKIDELANRKLMSAGIGHAFENMFIDISAQRITNDIQYSPYSNLETGQDVDISSSQYRALLTFGVRI